MKWALCGGGSWEANHFCFSSFVNCCRLLRDSFLLGYSLKKTFICSHDVCCCSCSAFTLDLARRGNRHFKLPMIKRWKGEKGLHVYRQNVDGDDGNASAGFLTINECPSTLLLYLTLLRLYSADLFSAAAYDACTFVCLVRSTRLSRSFLPSQTSWALFLVVIRPCNKNYYNFSSHFFYLHHLVSVYGPVPLFLSPDNAE